MLIFIVELDTHLISDYMATVTLPETFRYMKLDSIGLDASPARSGGRESLILTYTSPGRVEDYELYPEDHTRAMVRFLFEKVSVEEMLPVPYAPLWTWDEKGLRIFFTMKRTLLETGASPCETQDAFVSVTRKQIFLSKNVFSRYVEALLERSGFGMTEVSVVWSPAIGGYVAEHENLKVQLLITEEETLTDLLDFTGLKKTLTWISSGASVDFERVRAGADVSKEGMRIPLILRNASGGRRNSA
ncbi:MAG: hypothetical protein Q4D38_07430 [Planctomycetia bacterium]|nr:hypothetical protein [Planctomycetia bacterium]